MNRAAEVITHEHPVNRGDESSAVAEILREAFGKQRRAYLDEPTPGLEQRKQDLLTLKRLLGENLDAIVEAVNRDYGNR